MTALDGCQSPSVIEPQRERRPLQMRAYRSSTVGATIGRPRAILESPLQKMRSREVCNNRLLSAGASPRPTRCAWTVRSLVGADSISARFY